MLHIPEAYLVEEEGSDHLSDAYAEPLLPWWRQCQTKLLILAVFVLAVISLALGLTLGANATTTTLVFASSSFPSISPVPTSS
jgi:hypothetical protein